MNRTFHAVFASPPDAAVLAPSALRRAGQGRSVRAPSPRRATRSRAPSTPAPLPLPTRPRTRGAPGTNAAVGKPLPPDPRRAPGHRRPGFNDARPAPAWSDLLGQVTTAGTRRADYVTVLMGANDVCRSSEAAMTSVAEPSAPSSPAALARFSAARPRRPHLRGQHPRHPPPLGGRSATTSSRPCSPGARSASASRCSRRPLSMAHPETSSAASACASAAIAYNTQLADVCARYVHCRFDGNAAFNTTFVAADVSRLDFFHPSLPGAGEARCRSAGSAGLRLHGRHARPSSAAATRPVAADRSRLVALGASDDVGVAGIEYRTRHRPYIAATPGPLTLRARARSLTYRCGRRERQRRSDAIAPALIRPARKRSASRAC